MTKIIAMKNYFLAAVLTGLFLSASESSGSDLVLHLTFEDDFSQGVFKDVSGNNNNALRYSLTHWPSPTTGPDGSQAALFTHWPSTNPLYTRYGEGDYAGIPASPLLKNMPQATIALWAHYAQSLDSNWMNDSTDKLLDGCWYDAPGSWTFGRGYSKSTSFAVFSNEKDINGFLIQKPMVIFPDATDTGDTGGWHHYAVTFDGSRFRGYFDGTEVASSTETGVASALTIAEGIFHGNYLAVGTDAHGGTPEWGGYDSLPNDGWMNGAIDDVRIYNRPLSASEVAQLFSSVPIVNPTPTTTPTLTPTPTTTPTLTPMPTSTPGSSTKTGFLPSKNVFNPAKGETLTIKFDLAQDAHVSLILYNRSGRQVKTLLDENRSAGEDQNTPSWDGRNEQGSVVASGTYILVLKAGDVKQTKKVVIIK